MTRRVQADWMFAQALDLMAEADRMHRQFFRLAAAPRPQPTWESPADVFEAGDELVVVVALPGVSDERVRVAVEPGALVVQAERAPPFAVPQAAVRQLEIPYGRFERRIALPAGQWMDGTRELTHGCLVVRLHRATWESA
jgi:HSP20 family protein